MPRDANVSSRVDAVIQMAMTRYHIAGLSVGIAQEGTVLLAKGYGVVDVSTGRATDANTPFEIGSCAKSFTAFALMMIRDNPALIKKAGITSLDLNAPISTYLSNTPRFRLPDKWTNITSQQLLSMTSGIPNGASNTAPWYEVVKTAAGKPLCFPPGTGYCYSNPGFMVLGELIQQLTGMNYDWFMGRTVFPALNLGQTFIHLPNNTPANLAVGYTWNNQQSQWVRQNPRSPLSSFSSGAVITTAANLATFLAALQQQRILSAPSYALMWTPVPLPTRSSQWGYGWNVEKTERYTIYRKDGGLPGYAAQMSLYVGDKVAVAICTNESRIPGALIAAQVVAAVKKIARVPNPPGPISDCPK